MNPRASVPCFQDRACKPIFQQLVEIEQQGINTAIGSPQDAVEHLINNRDPTFTPKSLMKTKRIIVQRAALLQSSTSRLKSLPPHFPCDCAAPVFLDERKKDLLKVQEPLALNRPVQSQSQCRCRQVRTSIFYFCIC